MVRRGDPKKNVTRFLAICLLVSLLLGLGRFPLKGDEAEVKFLPPEAFGPRLLPESEMTAEYFMKVGNLPDFKDKIEEVGWLEMLLKLAKELTGPDVPYGGTLVVGHGVGADGYYWVWFKQDKMTEVNQDIITEIVEEINRVAMEIGFTKEVTIKFSIATGTGEFLNRRKRWRPIIGGVQVQNVDDDWDLITSTLGWSAKRYGVKGYVVSGHLNTEGRTHVGTSMYQPKFLDDPAGYCVDNPRYNSYADAAWIQFSNVAPKVYVSGLGFSIHWSQDPSVGSTVYMSGLTSGDEVGTVEHVGIDEECDGTHYGWLYDQALANIDVAHGDSGAPFYIAVSGWGRGIVGILSGESYFDPGLERFSPTSGVQRELGAIPLTVYG